MTEKKSNLCKNLLQLSRRPNVKLL